MRRLVVLATTVALATCQPGDEIASGSPAGDAASALLVVDLDPLVADTNDATSVRLTVNSEAVAELTLPARGDVLEGHAAWPVAAGVEVRVGLELLNGKVAWPGPTTQIQVATGEAVRLRATIDGRGRPMLVENARVLLGSSDGATVDYAASERGQAWQSRLGQRPVASLVGILADPQIAVVTPTSSQGSDASAIGPLVAWRHLETAVARTSVESQPSMDHPVPAYLRYYSYCSCGRAAVDREYELCTDRKSVV